MNVTLLILPCLAATLALSASKTLPADLRHDAKGKTPLSVAKMTAARGAGSTCRWGCDEHTNETCYPVYTTVGTVDHVERWEWNPHWECGFALGGDNCIKKPDVMCYRIYSYNTFSVPACSGQSTFSEVQTSTCTPPPPGN